jgi:putative lipoic acid-binding regulatory protein
MSNDTLLEFPCAFPIKMMGRNAPEFYTTVRSLVEKHTGALDDSAIKTALSRNSRFISVTVTVNAKSQQQLDDIYREVTSNDDVLMAL